MTKLAIIIPTHNRNELLQRTLRSLSECVPPNSHVELVVVENGGRFGAEALVRNLPDWLHARYEYFGQGNKSAALNHAIEQLDAEWGIFFDDDVRFAESVLVAYETAFASRPASFFGGPCYIDYEALPADWLLDFLPGSAKGWKLEGEAQARQDIEFLGANWACRLEDLRSVGGFNINFGPGAKSGSVGQESEMQSRLLKRGLRSHYVPDALVWHYVPRDRCSEAWMTARAFRIGVREGLLSKDTSRRLFGYSRWRLRLAVSLSVRSWASPFLDTREAAFALRLKKARNRGALRGSRIQSADRRESSKR